MASEISISGALSASKNGVTVTASSSVSVTMATTAANVLHAVQDVGTSVEDAALGDIDTTAEYWVKFKNLDATNFVDIIPATGGVAYIFRMRPGESFGPVRAIGSANPFRLKADTEACQVEVIAVEAGNPAA